MKLVQIPEDELAETIKVLGESTSVLNGLTSKRIPNNQQLSKKAGDDSAMKTIGDPDMTLFDGQTLDLINERRTADGPDATSYGIKIFCRVSPDRERVRLKLAALRVDADQMLESSIAVSVRNSDTVVCDVTRLLEIYRQPRTVTPAPLNAPATAETKEASPKSPAIREFLIITPRVSAVEEEEALLGIELPQR